MCGPEVSESGKVVFVVGGSSGIGRATSILYAKRGYKVAVHGHLKKDVDETVDECNKVSPNKLEAFGIVSNFSNIKECAPTVVKVFEHFGKINDMVFSAGIFLKSTIGDFDTYKQVMNINIDSAVATTFAVAKHIEESKGNIVFVSSVDSMTGYRGGFSYCCSKAALSMFAKCMAIEFDGKVRVNFVCPGAVETPLLCGYGLSKDQIVEYFKDRALVQRVGQPEEIAKVIYFLTSDDASYVMGQPTIIDGGAMLRTPEFVKEE